MARMRLIGKLGDVEFKRGQMQKAAEQFARALELGGTSIPKTTAGMLVQLSGQVARQMVHTALGRPLMRPVASPLLRLRWHLLSRMGHTFWFSRGALWTLLVIC